MMAENDVWLGSLSSPLWTRWMCRGSPRRTVARVARSSSGYENVMKLAKKSRRAEWASAPTTPLRGWWTPMLYEFEMRSKFFTPLEMLKQATSTNAELLRLANSRDPYKAAPLGVVKEGAWADVLIYGANPLLRTSRW